MIHSSGIFGAFLNGMAVNMTTESYIAGGAFLAGILLELVIMFFFLRMMYQAGAVTENHRREEVPFGTGISFPAVLTLIFTAYAIMARYGGWPIFPSSYQAYLLGVIALGMLGFLDDMLGSRERYGLWNNLRPLAAGMLDTGGLKTIGGFVICFLAAFLTTEGWLDCTINTLMVFFMVSIMNWLDLQPGRALKGFTLFLAAIVLIALGGVDYVLIAPLAGAVLCYFLYDLRSRALMGDAGSSILGFSLGFWAAASLSLSARVALLLFLVVVQVLAERFAIQEADEERSLFSRINGGGR